MIPLGDSIGIFFVFFMGNFTVKIYLKLQANNTKGLRSCANVKDMKNVNTWRDRRAFIVGISILLRCQFFPTSPINSM